MQSVLSRNWTRIAVSISYDDNHYTMGTNRWQILSEQMNYVVIVEIKKIVP